MKSFLVLGKDSKLAGFFLKKFGNECLALSKKDCDITDSKILKKVIKNNVVKYVINCAAITDVKLCEKYPENCFKANVVAVYNLSRLCQKYNKKLIIFSSDYAVSPVNIYGYSKFLSEKIIDPKRDLVIRTSFYSPDYYIVKSLVKQNLTNAYRNMYFNPISVTRLVDEVYKNKDKTGVLNIFAEKKISKFEFAKRFATIFEIDKKLIKPINYIHKKGEVKLPLNSFIISDVKVPLVEDLKLFLQSLKD